MYGHAFALLLSCARPGCTSYAAAVSDVDGAAICAADAKAELMIGVPA